MLTINQFRDIGVSISRLLNIDNIKYVGLFANNCIFTATKMK